MNKPGPLNHKMIEHCRIPLTKKERKKKKNPLKKGKRNKNVF
jgi:hypothetical protein